MNNLILQVDKRKDEIKLQTDTTAHIITKLQKKSQSFNNDEIQVQKISGKS